MHNTMRAPLHQSLRRSAVVLLVTALALVGLTVAPAQAITTPSILGTVVGPGGEPLAGVSVTIAAPGQPTDYLGTDRLGKFRYSRALAGGTVTATDSTGEYGTASTTVTAAAGAAVPVSLTLPLGTPSYTGVNVQGTVADTAGRPIRGLTVYLYPVEGNGSFWAGTDRTGTYRFKNVPAGQYRAEISGYVGNDNYQMYRQRYYPDAGTYAAAQVLTVPATGVLALAPVSLMTLGRITGTVGFGADPIADVNGQVTAFDSDGVPAAHAEVRYDGTYDLGGLLPGRYTVLATGSVRLPDRDFVEYVSLWNGGKSSMATAKPVTVGAGGLVQGVGFNLTRNLRTLTRPAITVPKKARKGKKVTKLVADTGVWNNSSRVQFSFTWKAGKKVVGHGSTLKLSKKVLKKARGKKIQLTVTATDILGVWATVSASAKPAKVSKSGAVKVKQSKKGKKGKK